MEPVKRDKCQHLRDKQGKQTTEKLKEGTGKRSRRRECALIQWKFPDAHVAVSQIFI